MVVDAHSLNNNLVRLDVPYAMTTLKIFTTMYLQQCFPATGIFLVLLDKSLDYIFFFFFLCVMIGSIFSWIHPWQRTCLTHIHGRLTCVCIYLYIKETRKSFIKKVRVTTWNSEYPSRELSEKEKKK